MSKLKIRNFGPIVNGMNDEWIDFSKVTVFIGNQGTGKSTIVKLLASFGWLEKKILRGYTTVEEVLASTKEQEYSLEKRLEYFNLLSYLKDNSYIEYKSSYFHFIIEGKKYKSINQIDIDCELSLTSKISYIPAERNFITAIESSSRMTKLPRLLSRFQAEYLTGLEELASEDNVSLNIDNLSVKYKKQSTIIVNNKSEFEIEIHEASSGIQSITPLLIHSQYNTNHIIKNSKNLFNIDLERFRDDKYNYAVESESIITKNVEHKIQLVDKELESNNNQFSILAPLLDTLAKLPDDQIQKVMKNVLDGMAENVDHKISSLDDIKNLDARSQVVTLKNRLKMILTEHNDKYNNHKKQLEMLEVSKFLDSSLTNIIEELEQNLYPESLKNILFTLLSQINHIELTYPSVENQSQSIYVEANRNALDTDAKNEPKIRYEHSKLILTTHSPFTISYLTLIAKAGNVLEEVKKTNKNEDEIKEAIERINKIVPIDALVTGDNMKIYHLEDGNITLLDNYNSMPSDNNLLNVEMREFNNEYRKLVQVKKSYYIGPEKIN